MTNPLDIIEAIRKSFIGSEQVYTNGSCIMFYKILKVLYPSARPYWNSETKHMITKIGNKYYDISGEIKNPKGYALDEGVYYNICIAVAFPTGEQNIRTANQERLF